MTFSIDTQKNISTFVFGTHTQWPMATPNISHKTLVRHRNRCSKSVKNAYIVLYFSSAGGLGQMIHGLCSDRMRFQHFNISGALTNSDLLANKSHLGKHYFFSNMTNYDFEFGKLMQHVNVPVPAKIVPFYFPY